MSKEKLSNPEHSLTAPTGEKGGSRWKNILTWGAGGLIVAVALFGSIKTGAFGVLIGGALGYRKPLPAS